MSWDLTLLMGSELCLEQGFLQLLWQGRWNCRRLGGVEKAVGRNRIGTEDLGIEKAWWVVAPKGVGPAVLFGSSYTQFCLTQWPDPVIGRYFIWPLQEEHRSWFGSLLCQLESQGWKTSLAVLWGEEGDSAVSNWLSFLLSFFAFSGNFSGKSSLELSGKHIHWSPKWGLDKDNNKFLPKKAICINLWIFCIHWRHEQISESCRSWRRFLFCLLARYSWTKERQAKTRTSCSKTLLQISHLKRLRSLCL